MLLDPLTRCGACGGTWDGLGTGSFFGVPVCNSCSKALGLDGLAGKPVPPTLGAMIGPEGQQAASGLTSLVSRMCREEGWKLLANIHGMTGALKEPSSKELLRGSLAIVGSTLVEEGIEGMDEPLDPRALTLSLVLGEVICLSIMKRLSIENGLMSKDRLDDVLVTALFRSKLCDFLLPLRKAARNGHESELASAVWTILG